MESSYTTPAAPASFAVMHDPNPQAKPLTVIAARSTRRYAEDRPALTHLTPVQANRIVAAMLHIGGMDHLRQGGDTYRQPRLRLGLGMNLSGPKVLFRAANFELDLETYLHEVLAPAHEGPDAFHSLIAGLGQYALSSLGQSDVRESDIVRLTPVFARAWETIDEAKRSPDAHVRGLAEVLDHAIHEGLGREPTKRTLVAR